MQPRDLFVVPVTPLKLFLIDDRPAPIVEVPCKCYCCGAETMTEDGQVVACDNCEAWNRR